jgi:hypothetical protein
MRDPLGLLGDVRSVRTVRRSALLLDLSSSMTSSMTSSMSLLCLLPSSWNMPNYGGVAFEAGATTWTAKEAATVSVDCSMSIQRHQSHLHFLPFPG